jgi:secreted trypsin-like serine protease
VVNGNDAQPGRLDFVVSLLDTAVLAKHGPFDAQFCGGTLTTATTVVTAAHCVVDPLTRVVADPSAISIGIGRTLKPSRVRVIPVVAVQPHPDYEPNSAGRDVAVLTLATPQPDLPTLTPLRPIDGQQYEAAGASARIAGWGTILPEDDFFPDALQSAPVVIFPRDSCGSGSSYMVAGVPFQGFHHGQADPEIMLCAAGTTPAGQVIDTCQGDSGGPLIVGDGLAARLVGIVSWGQDCAAQLPGVYTRVAAVADFLESANAIITLAPTQAPRLAATGLHDSIRISFDFPRDGSASVLAATATDHATGAVRACFTRPRRDGLVPTCIIKGLQDGISYAVAGISANSAGNSPALASIQVTPIPVPVPGRVIDARVHARGRADFAVSASRSVGSSIEATLIVCQPMTGGPIRTAPIRDSRAMVTGLRPIPYSCSVQARNAVGAALGDPVLIRGRR